MQKCKKIIAGIMTIFILATTTCVFPVFAQEPAVSIDDINFLISLGIYDSADEMDLQDDVLNRETVASLLSVFYGVTEADFPVKSNFADVSEYWASGHIVTMVQNGILRGYSDGLFRPKDAITLDELVKIFVCMTGHDALAELKGGYPKGYINEAKYCGILDGITYDDGNKKITKGLFTKLLLNAIEVPLIRQATYGEFNDLVMMDEQTLLTENLDIYIHNGFVMSTPHAIVNYKAPVGVGQIMIDKAIYDCDFDAYDRLGTRVKAYYKKTANDVRGKILYLDTPNNETEQVIIDADNISSVTASKFTYYDGNKSKTIDIKTGLIVVFNGKQMPYYTATEHLFPKQGSVRFVDVDDSNGYDYAIVSCEIDYVVKDVVFENGILKITEENGKTDLAIKMDDENTFCNVIYNGVSYNPEKIKPGDILTIEADSIDLATLKVKKDSKSYRITRSTEEIKGTVSMIKKDCIVVDEGEFKPSASADMSQLVLGTEYTFGLNYRGQIVYYEESGEQVMKYGILQTHAVKDEAFSSTLKLKLFSSDDKFIVLETAKKVSIDGVVRKTPDAMLTALKNASANFAATVNALTPADSTTPLIMQVPVDGIWQLIKYSVNADGKINKIDTLAANAKPLDTDLTLSMISPVYDKATNANLYLTYQANTLCIDGKYGFAMDSTLFDIGLTSEHKLNDKTYKAHIGSKPGVSTQSNFMGVACFDVDENMNHKAVLKVYPSPAITSQFIGMNDTTNFMLFQRVEYKTNPDGDFVPYMYGRSMTNGAELFVEMDSESILDNPCVDISEDMMTSTEARRVEAGDVIRWAADLDGKATFVQTFMTNDGEDGFAAKTLKGSHQGVGGKYYSTCRMGYGVVQNYNDPYMVFRWDDAVKGTTYEPRRIYGLKNVLMFDRSSGEVETAAITDIRTAKDYQTPDNVAVYFSSGSTITFIIYRD